MGRLERASALIAALVLASGCAASSLRETVTPGRPGMPASVPWLLNRELLMPGPGPILFLVEHRAGHAPEYRALDDLVAVAERYSGRAARWLLHRQGQPLELEPGASVVFVKYVGKQLSGFGLAYAREHAGSRRYFLIVNQDAHRPYRILMPERRLEEQTLVHEYGHLLGLPTLDHGYYPLYPDFSGGMHCVNPDCPLSKPRPRSVLYNAFAVAFGRHYLEDYCTECKAAIAAAQAHWRGAGP